MSAALVEMAADALSTSEVSLDLLVRYDRAPESLPVAERRRVEAYLAQSPAHRDRARVMVRLAAAADPVQLLTSEEVGAAAAAPADASERGEAAAGGAEIVPFMRRRSTRVALRLAATLAAVLAVGLLLTQLGDRQGAPGDSQRQIAEQPAVPAEGRDPAQRPDPAGPTQQTRVAERSVDPPHDPSPAPPAPREPTAPAPRPRLELAEDSAPTGPAPPDIAPAPTAPGETVTAEPAPILLAALLDAGPYHYSAPPGFAELVRVDGVARSAGGSAVLRTLAPATTGLTLAPGPTLRWFVSADVEAPQEVVVVDVDARRPILTRTLPGPTRAGFHALSLADHNVTLEYDVTYRWGVSLIHDEARRARDTVATTELRRVRAPEALPSMEDDALRGHALAEAGLWYDALDFLSEQIERHPESDRLRAFRAGLLEGVGLVEAAGFDGEASAGPR